MKEDFTHLCRYVLLGLLAVVLMAGCAPSTEPPVQEIATAVPPTADPLYTLQCIRKSGKGDLCYASDVLAADPKRLEEAVKKFCSNKMDLLCSIHVWKDEASVAQSVPLTDAEKANITKAAKQAQELADTNVRAAMSAAQAAAPKKKA